MKKIYAKCKIAGTLILNTGEHAMRGDFVDSDLTGGLEHFTFKTHDALVKVANSYDFVKVNGRKMQGKKFSKKQAEQMFAE